jgi:hypothetical protein
MPLQPGRDLWMLVGGVVVENHVGCRPKCQVPRAFQADIEAVEARSNPSKPGDFCGSALGSWDLSPATGRNPLSKIFGALIEEVRFAADSPLEGTGFEPSVPRGKGPTLRVSVLFRSDFSVGGNQPEATFKDWSCHAGPMVRILLSPAVSHERSANRASSRRPRRPPDG